MKYILFLSFILIISCDNVVHVNGKVLDKKTGKPLVNAIVNLQNGCCIKKTNVKGDFEVSCFFGNSVPQIDISVKGYKPFHMKFNYNGDYNKFEIRTKSIWCNYDKPIILDESKIVGTWLGLKNGVKMF